MHVTTRFFERLLQRFAAQSRRRRGALRFDRDRDGERIRGLQRAGRASRVRLARQARSGSPCMRPRPRRRSSRCSSTSPCTRSGSSQTLTSMSRRAADTPPDRSRVGRAVAAEHPLRARRDGGARGRDPPHRRRDRRAARISTARRRLPRRPWRSLRTTSPPTGPPRRARRHGVRTCPRTGCTASTCHAETGQSPYAQ